MKFWASAMASHFAFAASLPAGRNLWLKGQSLSCDSLRTRPFTTDRRRINSRQPTMQLPPASHVERCEPPYSEDQIGPPDYKWDPAYPGTLKPGTVDDNFPLKRCLESDVYDNMKYEEYDIDERTPRVFAPEEDLLQWLSQQGRLLPRGLSDDEFDTEAEKQMSGITEEDLEFADDDSKMIAYYSKQGEGSAAGASADFGGFAEPAANESGL